MKKIMFNDRFALTEAVLEGRKTMTRRLVGNRMTDDDIKAYLKGYTELANKCAPYKIGEVVAVAQRGIDIYRILQKRFGETSDAALGFKEMYEGMPMWNNRMFTPAGFCLNHIRITDVKVERLQDISDENCMCEGIQAFDAPVGKIFVAGGVYVGQDGRLKIDKGMISLAKPFKTPQEAFAVHISQVSGKGTWNRNPYVFAYTFKLVR